MAFNVMDNLKGAAGNISDFLFKGTAQSTLGVGSYAASFIGGKIGQHASSAASRSLFAKAYGPSLNKSIFLGAGAGLTASAVGLGLRGIFGDDYVREEGPAMGSLKGALIGGATGLGVMGGFGINDMFKRASFQKNAAGLIEEGGFVGRNIARGARTLGSPLGLGMMVGGAALGGGAMLLKSIISTNFTQSR